ncbi:hypothetical protein FRC07_006943 [Ceratobasidium sp. 392]|nr:hypothetical protein FRC07_006943 [Ceratobasidium sp. 392]
MPLRRLRLGKVRLQLWDDPEDSDVDDKSDSDSQFDLKIQWRDFLLAVPHLEELNLEVQFLESSHLPLIASMLPNLRLLVLAMIRFDRLEVSTGKAAIQPVTIRCPCYDTTKGDDLSDVASIWPSAKCEEWISWIFGGPYNFEVNRANEINETMELLRSKEG